MHIIIPLSGSGSRFINEGYLQPKPLIKIGNKFMIEYVIEQFSKNDQFTFICSKKHIQENNIKNILLKLVPNATIYEIEPHKYGPVFAVRQIFDKINDNNEDIIISYCDYGTVWNYNAFKKYIADNDFDGCIPYYTGFHPSLLGTDNYATMLDKNDILIEIKEKHRFKENKFDEKISNGCYYFKNSFIMKKYFQQLLDKHITCKEEYYVSLVYNLLVEDNLKVGLFKIDKMIQLGTPKDLQHFEYWLDYFKNKKNKNIQYTDFNNTTLLLPMAGLGSRFSDFLLPKPFLPINNKPMFIEAVKQLPDTQNKIFICQEKHNELFDIKNIVSKYLDYQNNNCMVKTIDYVTEGQACTVASVLHTSKNNNFVQFLYDNPILISACDNGIYFNQNEYQELLNDKSIDIIVFAFRNHHSSTTNPQMYAWLDIDSQEFIKHVYCKFYPFNDEPKNHYAIIGTMFFRKGEFFFKNNDTCVSQNVRINGEFYVDTVLNECINQGLRVKMFCVDDYLCWGTSTDYKVYKYWEQYFTNT